MKLSCCVVLGLAGAAAGDTLMSGLAKRPVRPQWTEEGALLKIEVRNFACEDAPCPPIANSVDLRPSSL